MDDSHKEIVHDIESTLDELIELGSALKTAKTSASFNHEVEALEKLQESLLARLIDRESVFDRDPKKKMLESIRRDTLYQKIAEYGKKGARKKPQKRANFRSASSKSKG